MLQGAVRARIFLELLDGSDATVRYCPVGASLFFQSTTRFTHVLVQLFVYLEDVNEASDTVTYVTEGQVFSKHLPKHRVDFVSASTDLRSPRQPVDSACERLW